MKAVAAAILQMFILGAVDAGAEQPSLTLLTSKELSESLNEYAFVPFGSKTERFLIKWKGGIRFGASKDGDVTPEIVDFLSEELGVISRLTRLKVESKNDDANLIVVFTDNPQRDFPKYKSQLGQLFVDEAGTAALYKGLTEGEFLCAGKILVTDKKEITHYFFFVSTQGQDQSKVKACIFRELMRALGLPHLYLPSSSAPSFSQDFERLRGTAHALLAFLYRDDVPAGLSRSEVMRMINVDVTK